MQVKKFEAPTIQEALDAIKRELGPEAIILQTKKNKKGFGLMSKASVEVTAAVSERSLQKKKYTQSRLPEPTREKIEKLPATQQATVFNKYADRALERRARETQDRVELRKSAAAGAQAVAKQITSMRYIDIEDDQPRGQAKRRAPETANPQSTNAQIANAQPASSQSASGMSIQDELKHLKRMLQEMKAAQEETGPAAGAESVGRGQGPFATGALQDAFDQLVVNGIDKRHALGLIKRVGFDLGDENAKNPEAVLDQLAEEIMSSTEVSSPLSGITGRNTSENAETRSGPSIIAIVGPTGVGKTTTVAKLASEALLKRNLKVGLVNLDCYKIGAFDQLATYAKILNVPFRSVSSLEDLKTAIQDFKSLDLVLVDTTGRSQRDPGSLKEMQNLLWSIPGMQSQLVLSATTRDNELYDMANRFAIFRPEGIIVSKLDEASLFGSIYNVVQKVKLPLLYFTTGQRVPEDIEEATRERLAALILDL